MIEEEKRIDRKEKDFVTVCLNCAFAEWDGDEQVGCELGRIDKFKVQSKVEYFKNEDGKLYYIINTICNRCCNNAYLEKIKNLKEIVIEMSKINYDLVINAVDDDVTYDDIVSTLLNFKETQSVQPKNIIIVIQGLSYATAFDKLKESIDVETEPMEITRVIDQSRSFDSCMDLGAARVNANYYLVVDAKKPVKDCLTYVLDSILNEELRPFVMAYDKEDPWHCLLVQNKLHQLFRGNGNMPIFQKIEEASEEQMTHDLISGDLILDINEECRNYQESLI